MGPPYAVVSKIDDAITIAVGRKTRAALHCFAPDGIVGRVNHAITIVVARQPREEIGNLRQVEAVHHLVVVVERRRA